MKIVHGKKALVIGGSMAGLLAARVLSDHYAEVLILDRDVFPDGPEPRKGVAQTHQPHVFLLQGLQIMEKLFPGFSGDMINAGAMPSDGEDWCVITHIGKPVPVYMGQLIGATRSFLEWHVRQRVICLPNVRVVSGVEVLSLTGSQDGRRVTGVRIHGRQVNAGSETLEADLIVDAGGRYSKTPVWLAGLGYPRVPEDVVNAGVGYSSRIFRKPDTFPVKWHNALVQPRPPHNARMGVLISVEGNRWQVMIGGTAKEYPPSDENGFLAWARTLADPCIYEAIRLCEPLTPVRSFRIPETHFRRFEKLPYWPTGFIVLGDAVCAFNPIYAQGITVASMEADALLTLLQKKISSGWEKVFQKQVAKIAAEAWMIGTGEDLRWNGVQINDKPAGFSTRFLHRYMDQLLATACTNVAISRAFFEVLQMRKPSSSLMHPKVLFPVLWHNLWGGSIPDEARHGIPPAMLTALQQRTGTQTEFSALNNT